MGRHFSSDVVNDLDATTSNVRRRPDAIVETSEPNTPDGTQDPSTYMTFQHDSASLRSRGASGTSLDIHSTQAGSTARVPSVIVTNEDSDQATETSTLLPRERLTTYRKRYDSVPEYDGEQPAPRKGIWNRFGHHYPSFKGIRKFAHIVCDPKAWDLRQAAHVVILRPASMLPSVFLGLLLNLLDALSYGIILFPLGEEIFSSMGADGVSMFYVSCIISQLVYSTGSIFRGGVGSEMVRQLSQYLCVLRADRIIDRSRSILPQDDLHDHGLHGDGESGCRASDSHHFLCYELYLDWGRLLHARQC